MYAPQQQFGQYGFAAPAPAMYGAPAATYGAAAAAPAPVSTVGSGVETGSIGYARPGPVVLNYENVVMRVPTHRRQKNIYVPGPVITRTLQAPPQVVVRKVQVQGPAQIEKVQVQGPAREVVRKIAVPGPAREVVRVEKVQLPPQRVVKKVRVQGEPREIIKRVEVRGAPTEVIRKVLVPGAPTYEDVPQDTYVPGPAREEVRDVPVIQNVYRQVVREIPVPQFQQVAVGIQGPQEDKIWGIDANLELENSQLKEAIAVYKNLPERQMPAYGQPQFAGAAAPMPFSYDAFTYAAPIGAPVFGQAATQTFAAAPAQQFPVQQYGTVGAFPQTQAFAAPAAYPGFYGAAAPAGQFYGSM